MSNIIILYHSGVGNTKMVAGLIKDQLDENNCVVFRSVEEKIDLKQLSSYDILIFGFPTYHSEPSKTMTRFISKIPRFSTLTPCFIFTTCGFYSENSLRVFSNYCKEKNLQIIHWASYRTAATDGVLLAPSIKFFSSFEKNIVNKICIDVKKMLTIYTKSTNINKRLRFKLYSILNYPNKKLGKIYHPDIYIDNHLCVKCWKCVNSCFYHCFNMEEGQSLQYLKEDCEYCYRCIHFCPTKALSLYKNKGHSKQLTDQFFINQKEVLKNL